MAQSSDMSENHQDALDSEIESELTWDGSAIRVHANGGNGPRGKRRGGSKVTREKSLKFHPGERMSQRYTHNRGRSSELLHHNLAARAHTMTKNKPAYQEESNYGDPYGMHHGVDMGGGSRARPQLFDGDGDTSEDAYGGVTYQHSEALRQPRRGRRPDNKKSSVPSTFPQIRPSYYSATSSEDEPIYAMAAKSASKGERPLELPKLPEPGGDNLFKDVKEMEHFIDNFPLYESASAFLTEHAAALLAGTTTKPKAEESIYARASQSAIIVPDNHVPAYQAASEFSRAEVLAIYEIAAPNNVDGENVDGEYLASEGNVDGEYTPVGTDD